MEPLEAVEIIGRGEDSRHQFKREFNGPKQAASEMVAFANTEGGQILIGVEDKTGNLTGLTAEQIRRQNEIISSAAMEHVRSPITPRTENVSIGDKTIIVVTVDDGIDKPYFDSDGIIWQKVGADKRRITSKEEFRRLFQDSDLLRPDEIPVRGCNADQIDMRRLRDYYVRRFQEEFEIEGELSTFLQNLSLAKGDELNVAGLLLFGMEPQRFKPLFVVKAVRFDGIAETGSDYLDSEDFHGTLSDQYEGAFAFIRRNLPKRQNGQSINSEGIAEIPDRVFEELLVNALLHRNYLLSAPIRLFFFDDRIEIISPGSLPNHLTVEQMRRGISSVRNSILVSFAAHGLLPYRGIGTGVRRAIEAWPQLQLYNDAEGNLFKATIPLAPAAGSTAARQVPSR